ncbi:aminotransferase-like domain-containing protein [Niallia sp. 01092]|uniref:aminotransferase-like domain-containing protein n=1 Tax=unclassified Niallia TaxID=2837522 RepID=UPI003FCFA0D7
MFKYLSLLNDLESLIQSGQLKEGEKLPSIRTLAERHQCSKSTVISALKELEKRHMVYSVPKSGYYVVKKRFESNNTLTKEIDFAASAPDWNLFPYLDFQHCLNKAIDTYQQDLFVYGTPKGLPSLIKMVQKQLEIYQVFTKTENIFITSGVQQALFILSMLAFPNNKTKILIEQPSYHLFIEQLNAHRVPAVGIKRTARGINLDELERIFREEDIKFFYTMPRFHNPLGTSYSKREKEEIVKLATKYDVYIVEDDYLADFEQHVKIDPIFSYDTNNRVIYLKSYSKIIFPGLRVGVAVLPDLLMESFQQYKRISDIDSSMISQAALEIYIKSGMFERHKNKVNLSYLERANMLYQSLEKYAANHLEHGTFLRPASICMMAHLILPKTVNVPQLIKNLRSQQIQLDTIDRNYLKGVHQEKIMKLNVSNVEVAKIEEGVRLILKEMNNSRNHFF